MIREISVVTSKVFLNLNFHIKFVYIIHKARD